jgi:hypothetical protein
MLRVIAVMFLSVTAVIAAEKTTLRKTWASRSYTTNTIPAPWRPANTPPTVTDVGAFESFSLRTETLSIQKFIARFGLPSRYLATSKPGAQDFLIYDLPSGHAVALYVPKPPAGSFAALAIIASDGSLVRLIK